MRHAGQCAVEIVRLARRPSPAAGTPAALGPTLDTSKVVAAGPATLHASWTSSKKIEEGILAHLHITVCARPPNTTICWLHLSAGLCQDVCLQNALSSTPHRTHTMPMAVSMHPEFHAMFMNSK